MTATIAERAICLPKLEDTFWISEFVASKRETRS